MGIAFFDLDKTLLSANSGSLWVRSELREGYITRTQALRASWWLVRYHLGFAAMDAALREAIASLAGSREADVRARTHRFYDRDVQPIYRPGARRVLDAHRARGDRLVLLTTSSNYLSERVAVDLALDDYLCNRFEVDADGRFTGRPHEPLCFGSGKVPAAVAFAERHGVPLSACAFYTDSVSDLPMLERVGRPVAVHPDPRLRRVARARGWPIADWGR